MRVAKGFTLIELMIVVAVIGILAAIAIPNYNESVRRGKRADAQTQLQEAAQFMQRYYSANDRYTLTAGTTTTESVQTDMLPATLRQAPKSGTANYTITVQARDNTPTYTLKAAPANSMSGDRCGTLTLNSKSEKGISSGASGVNATDCWR